MTKQAPNSPKTNWGKNKRENKTKRQHAQTCVPVPNKSETYYEATITDRALVFSPSFC